MNYFWRGIFYCMGFYMFIQDSMGLEKYVSFVQQHWIEMSPFWGLLVMFLAVWGIKDKPIANEVET